MGVGFRGKGVGGWWGTDVPSFEVFYAFSKKTRAASYCTTVMLSSQLTPFCYRLDTNSAPLMVMCSEMIIWVQPSPRSGWGAERK